MHSEMEIGNFLDGCLEGFSFAVEIGFSVYADLGVFLNSIKEIFECCVVFEVIKFSRNTADEEFRFVAIGCRNTNVGELKCHYIPDYGLLEDLAKKRGIAFNSRAELCNNKRIVQFVMDRIDTIQQDLAGYEQVKRITILPEPLSMERGELTNTLKVRRPVLNELYKEEIDKMYEEQ